MEKIRAFIAIPLPTALRNQLAELQKQLRRELPGLRTGAPHNLHLTLNFLGDQTHDQLAKIGRFMLSIVGSQTPFSQALQGLGTFPGGKRPRVVWLGVQPPEPLLNLQHQLAVGLNTFGGLTENTPYRPHLTLGRFRQPPADLTPLSVERKIVFDPFLVDSVILYSSRLTPQGAVHRALTIAKMKGAGLHVT